jgi:hypothetical protein
MESNSNLGFPSDKLTALKAAHAQYLGIKEEFLAGIVKTTDGKQNTSNIPSAIEWLDFVLDNPKAVTDTTYIIEDFAYKAKAHEALKEIEKIENQAQAHTKALRDIVSSDLRYYWTNAEDFYIVAAGKDSIISEKYKDLSSISPKRKSDNQIEKDFKKLEVRRSKKNGDITDTKAA